MPPAKIVRAQPKTLSFIRFREKHIELSEIYWKHVIGTQAVNAELVKHAGNSVAVNVLGIATTQKQYGFTASETISSSAAYLDRTRLHLLAICCANLESFLKDVTFCHIALLGFKEKAGQLSESGEALAYPILGKASLPEPLKYAAHLFNLNFGIHATCLNLAYKYRCALVHNGGVVTPRTIKELSLAPSRLNSRLVYPWADLQKALEAAFEIATLVDRKLSSYAFRMQEIERELSFLRDAKLLDANKIWSYIYDQGIALPRKRDRELMLQYVMK